MSIYHSSALSGLPVRKRTFRSVLLCSAVAVGFLTTLPATPTQAQSPGGNLGALMARLKADEASIASLQNTINQMVSSGVTPSGPAGGDLSGSYPSPTIAPNTIDNGKLASNPDSLTKVSGGYMTVQNSGDIVINQNQDFCIAPFDAFGYGGSTMGNYGIGWFSDPDYVGAPSAWLSGYGEIKLFTHSAARLTIDHDGLVGIDTTTPQSALDVNGTITANSLQITGGSDLAEPYKITTAAHAQPLPGMVVAIDPDQTGQMRISTHAYDTGVAGIISGANGIKPGVVLRQAGTIADGTLPVASVGRVWCDCDADAGGAIHPGDLLTTSATPGHAMRVRDYDKAKGAILGKAMSPLKSGKGLVLVLVTLE